MSHLVYLSNNGWVCEKPELLGHDFLIVSYEGKPCMDCTRLVVAYNARVDKYELTLALPTRQREPAPEPRPSFGQAVAITSVFWITFFIGIWSLFN